MRSVVYGMMVSLDGYIEGPNQDLSWANVDEELHQFFNDLDREAGGFLYGRRTYEVMAGFWPTADADPSALPYIVDYARIWRSVPKIVFSKTLDKVEWNSRLVKENPAEEVIRLKQQPGKDLFVGGAGLAASLMQHDLIDRFQIYVQPVIIGRGTPMFSPFDQILKLRLLESRTFGSGVVYLHYERTDRPA